MATRACACAEVIHHGHILVGEVHKVPVAIAADDHHGVDVLVRNHHILGDLDGRARGAAAVLHVDSPCVLGADLSLHIQRGGRERIFLPFFADAEDQIDAHRVDIAARERVLCGANRHLLRSVVFTRDALLHDAEFLLDCVLAPDAFGRLGDFARCHNALRQIETIAPYTNAVIWHTLLPLSSKNRWLFDCHFFGLFA